EDTLFGQELKARGIPIHHIENPLLHLGLDTAIIFIEKTKIAVENLKYLIAEGQIDEDIRLYKYYQRLNKIGLAKAVGRSFKTLEKHLISRLKQKNPSLFLFDIFKLFYLCFLLLEFQSDQNPS
ncbi:MAG: glycosyltransferase family 2 protein, partial [Schleiferiaceae bacterium]|nr:glycosyltransferase family 2 protein [Schleiferiaceae bacterium]